MKKQDADLIEKYGGTVRTTQLKPVIAEKPQPGIDVEEVTKKAVKAVESASQKTAKALESTTMLAEAAISTNNKLAESLGALAESIKPRDPVMIKRAKVIRKNGKMESVVFEYQ